MNLTNLIETKEIEQELEFIREGNLCKAYPKDDCTIDGSIDTESQLEKVSGSYYFYGQILGEITQELNKNKVALKSRKAAAFLEKNIELTQLKARCTDSILKSLVDVDSEAQKIQGVITILEGTESKLETILMALKLKQEGLIEIGRKRNLELKINAQSINNLD